MFNFYPYLSRAAGLCTLLVLLLLASLLPAAAQAPAWRSVQAVATAASTGNFSQVTATAVDAVGNVYLTGSFRNTVTLGSITLTSLGNNDIFVAKFNPVSNQFIWAQRAGGTGYEYASALAVSGTNVYVTGSFNSATAGFGAITLANASVSPNMSDVYVAKLTDVGSTGSFVWAQQAGGRYDDGAYAVGVSGSSVYVTGFFAGLATFGTTTLASAGNSDMCVAKLTDAGNTGSFVWAQQAGGMDADGAFALAVSGTSVYVAGSFSSLTAGFGATTLSSAGSDDVFVAKLTDAGPTGSFVWAQRAGSTGHDGAYALAVSGASVYVAGEFRGATAGFGTVSLTNANAGQVFDDVFVAKLTDTGPTGSFVWALRAGGTGEDTSPALAVSGTNVYVAGYFAGAASSFGTTTLASAGAYDAFVAKLTDGGNTGTYAWALRAGGSANDYCTSLALSGTNVYVAGYTLSPTADFGTATLFSSAGNTLGFLAALTDPTITATTARESRVPTALYPNPATARATLELAGLREQGPVQVEVVNVLGQTVRQLNTRPKQGFLSETIDLNGLATGVYTVRLHAQEGTVVKRLVKE